MTEEKFATLLARNLSGEISAEELQELNDWTNKNTGDGFFAGLLSAYWKDYTPSSLINKTANAHFEHILKTAEEENRAAATNESLQSPVKGKLYRLIKFAAAAAILAGLVLGALVIFKNRSFNKIQAFHTQPIEVAAASGARSQLLLPDGSKVWLNSNSKLHYNQSFNDSIREVFLDGEAYFDVVKNPERPFIVHTSAIDIRVLGTAFNVKSYDSDKTIETTLIRGSVEVTNKLSPSSPKIILQSKEKLVFENTMNLQKNEKIPAAASTTLTDNKTTPYTVINLPENLKESALAETSWVHNRLVFDGDSFRELALKMERWYSVEIDFKNEAVANYRLRGVFEDETVDQALQALQLIAPFKYKIKNKNKIEITK